jgi:hypothetical protein
MLMFTLTVLLDGLDKRCPPKGVNITRMSLVRPSSLTLGLSYNSNFPETSILGESFQCPNLGLINYTLPYFNSVRLSRSNSHTQTRCELLLHAGIALKYT